MVIGSNRLPKLLGLANPKIPISGQLKQFLYFPTQRYQLPYKGNGLTQLVRFKYNSTTHHYFKCSITAQTGCTYTFRTSDKIKKERKMININYNTILTVQELDYENR